MSQINWFVAHLLISKEKPSRQTWVSVLLIALRISILQRKRGGRRRGNCHLSYKHCNCSNEYFQYFNLNSLRASCSVWNFSFKLALESHRLNKTPQIWVQQTLGSLARKYTSSFHSLEWEEHTNPLAKGIHVFKMFHYCPHSLFIRY